MGRKCCVTFCKGNYDAGNKAKVFRLPTDKCERERWIRAIPRDNIPDSRDTSVCENHWPPGYATIKVHGKERPREPPSVFSQVPLSMIPTPPSKLRQTTRCDSSVRNKQDDEMPAFIKQDRITFDVLTDSAHSHSFVCPVTCFTINDIFHLQSNEYFANCIPMFVIKISNDLKFQTYHAGVQCYVPSLSKNRITKLDSWSKLEEAIRHLNSMPIEHKKHVIGKQLNIMNSPLVGYKIYDNSTIVRAFEYFCISRSLYDRLRVDFKLPSIKTLTKITSIVNKLDDTSFMASVFSKLPEKQQKCILLVDEVYVKPLLQYSVSG